MPTVSVVGLILLTFTASACFGQHAREYYKELHDAGGLDGMADQYVCFYESPASQDNFFLLADSNIIKQLMIENGTLSKLTKEERTALDKGFLIIHGYVKGVPHTDRDFFYARDGEWVSDRFILGKNTPAEEVFSIVWQTLRYKQSVIIVRADGSRRIAGTAFGRCEKVDTTVTQLGN